MKRKAMMRPSHLSQRMETYQHLRIKLGLQLKRSSGLVMSNSALNRVHQNHSGKFDQLGRETDLQR